MNADSGKTDSYICRVPLPGDSWPNGITDVLLELVSHVSNGQNISELVGAVVTGKAFGCYSWNPNTWPDHRIPHRFLRDIPSGEIVDYWVRGDQLFVQLSKDGVQPPLINIYRIVNSKWHRLEDASGDPTWLLMANPAPNVFLPMATIRGVETRIGFNVSKRLRAIVFGLKDESEAANLIELEQIVSNRLLQSVAIPFIAVNVGGATPADDTPIDMERLRLAKLALEAL